MSVREVNLNFDARQAVIYDQDGNPTRLVGKDFTQFEGVKTLCEQAGIKTPEQVKAEKIAKLDEQLAKIQAEKDAVVNGVKPVDKIGVINGNN